ncbi:MAG TPA: DUF4230 domain-containing protein [Polyangiaceae bacterium]|nr:DUF4230 domain-containing protein [Polyangiaceae bacterium]
MASEPVRVPSRSTLFVALAGGVGLLLGMVAIRSCAPPSLPALPPASSAVTVVKANPNVLVAIKDLARLESAQFHMERVIDLSEKQSHLFGLVESEDAILLVAVADVSAGVDLNKVMAEQIKVDHEKKSVEITLPPAEIFHTELDSEKTYVHTRRTGVLARRQEQLETKARQEAERALVKAAQEAGIEQRAGENAKRVVEGMVRSLGFTEVTVTLGKK